MPIAVSCYPLPLSYHPSKIGSDRDEAQSLSRRSPVLSQGLIWTLYQCWTPPRLVIERLRLPRHWWPPVRRTAVVSPFASVRLGSFGLATMASNTVPSVRIAFRWACGHAKDWTPPVKPISWEANDEVWCFHWLKMQSPSALVSCIVATVTRELYGLVILVSTPPQAPLGQCFVISPLGQYFTDLVCHCRTWLIEQILCWRISAKRRSWFRL